MKPGREACVGRGEAPPHRPVHIQEARGNLDGLGFGEAEAAKGKGKNSVDERGGSY